MLKTGNGERTQLLGVRVLAAQRSQGLGISRVPEEATTKTELEVQERDLLEKMSVKGKEGGSRSG